MTIFESIAAKLEFKQLEPGADLHAGDVLKLRDGRIVLVGHVNPLRGLSDASIEYE